MKNKFAFTQIIFALAFVSLLAKNSSTSNNFENGELHGLITDSKTGEGLSFATIILLTEGNTQVTGTIADIDGNYIVKPITPGKYNLQVSFVGYSTVTVNGLIISEGKITVEDIKLTSSGVELNELTIRTEKLIEPDKTTSGSTSSHSEIQHSAINRNNPNNIAAKTAGVYQLDNGGGLNINGSRNYSQKYYVDGIPMRGSISLPSTTGNTQSDISGNLPSQFQLTKNKNHRHDVIVNTPPPTPQIVYTPPVIYNDEEYAPLIENEFKSVTDEPLSTFSLDVDDASYTNFRRFIDQGQVPPKNAIRIEEFINNFQYDYPQPIGDDPFSVTLETAACPWNAEHKIVSIGIKGKTVSSDTMPANNLVFLIDVSGSMQDFNKLPLVKNCFKLLVNKLRPEDDVAIVVYAGNAGMVLSSTSGSRKEKINSAIDALEAGGSTAGGQGIELAYKIAKENFKQKGNNRVILATDGDFNVGVSSDDDLMKLIESKRDDGIFLTVLGFGMGNYKDAKMELLADKGNGNYSYIDNFSQGKKIFVEQLSGTLYTIAKDVKLQLEFNPQQVQSYRLIGYENRLLNKEDFNNDKKDAGELGAGLTVTALYEIIPAGPEFVSSTIETSSPKVDPLKYQLVSLNMQTPTDEMLTVKMRYKKPDETKSNLLSVTLKNSSETIDSASENFRFAVAVAEFGMLLRQSKFIGAADFDYAINLAKQSKGVDENGSRAEFIKLASTTSELIKSQMKKVK